MKRLFLSLALLLTAVSALPQDSTRVTADTRLLVYYFHITNRCHTCTSIEAAVRKTLTENFQTELYNNNIVFRSFNVDLPENKEICDKYSAYGADLALTKLDGGKEKIVDLTNYAFAKIHDEKIFMKGLMDKINELLR